MEWKGKLRKQVLSTLVKTPFSWILLEKLAPPYMRTTVLILSEESSPQLIPYFFKNFNG
jgi:hypothetical protein